MFWNMEANHSSTLYYTERKPKNKKKKQGRPWEWGYELERLSQQLSPKLFKLVTTHTDVSKAELKCWHDSIHLQGEEH